MCTHLVDLLLLRLLLELRDVLAEGLGGRREPGEQREALRRDHREHGLAERLLRVERLLDLRQQVRRVAVAVLHEVRLLQPLVAQGLLGCRTLVGVDREAVLDEVLRSLRDVCPVLLCVCGSETAEQKDSDGTHQARTCSPPR